LIDFCSEAMLEGWRNDPENFQTADEQLDAYIRFYNACFECPADFHLGIHLCRGNYLGSKHFSEGASRSDVDAGLDSVLICYG